MAAGVWDGGFHRDIGVGLQSSLLPSCIVSRNGLSGPSLWALTLNVDSFDKKTISKAPVMREKYLDP